MENYKFDGILRNVLNDNKGYENFFDNIFSFLLRHSDFFKGLERNKEIVLQSAKKFTEKYKTQLKQRRKDELLKRNKEINEQKKREEELNELKDTITDEKIEEKNIEIKNPVKTNEKNENGKLIPNKGNGSDFESYSWTQTFTDLNMIVPLNDDYIRSKHLEIEFSSKHVLIKDLKNNKTLIDNEFYSEIKYRDEDINWILDYDDNQNKILNINLEKFKQEKKLWTKLFTNEEELDEDKLEVKPMEVDELDEETREEYMKLMYDKNEKKKVHKSKLPTEENLKKCKDRNVFNKLAEKYPEMDFSECKFN